MDAHQIPGQVQPDADFIPAASTALYTLPRPMLSVVAMSVTATGDKPGHIAGQRKSSISNISRISMTEDPGIGLGQRLTHLIASSRSLTVQIQ
jgi:hypothetical protein